MDVEEKVWKNVVEDPDVMGHEFLPSLPTVINDIIESADNKNIKATDSESIAKEKATMDVEENIVKNVAEDPDVIGEEFLPSMQIVINETVKSADNESTTTSHHKKTAISLVDKKIVVTKPNGELYDRRKDAFKLGGNKNVAERAVISAKFPCEKGAKSPELLVMTPTEKKVIDARWDATKGKLPFVEDERMKGNPDMEITSVGCNRKRNVTASEAQKRLEELKEQVFTSTNGGKANDAIMPTKAKPLKQTINERTLFQPSIACYSPITKINSKCTKDEKPTQVPGRPSNMKLIGRKAAGNKIVNSDPKNQMGGCKLNQTSFSRQRTTNCLFQKNSLALC